MYTFLHLSHYVLYFMGKKKNCSFSHVPLTKGIVAVVQRMDYDILKIHGIVLQVPTCWEWTTLPQVVAPSWRNLSLFRSHTMTGFCGNSPCCQLHFGPIASHRLGAEKAGFAGASTVRLFLGTKSHLRYTQPLSQSLKCFLHMKGQ